MDVTASRSAIPNCAAHDVGLAASPPTRSTIVRRFGHENEAVNHRRVGGIAANPTSRKGAEKKKVRRSEPFSLMLAERTGLEPATPGVTGRYSNQLNYRSTVRYNVSDCGGW